MRTTGMRASPGLMTPNFHITSWWLLGYRATVLAIGVGALMAFTVMAFIAEAH